MTSPLDLKKRTRLPSFSCLMPTRSAFFAATFQIATLPGWVYVVTALAYVAGSLAIVLRRYLTVTV